MVMKRYAFFCAEMLVALILKLKNWLIYVVNPIRTKNHAATIIPNVAICGIWYQKILAKLII